MIDIQLSLTILSPNKTKLQIVLLLRFYHAGSYSYNFPKHEEDRFYDDHDNRQSNTNNFKSRSPRKDPIIPCCENQHRYTSLRRPKITRSKLGESDYTCYKNSTSKCGPPSRAARSWYQLKNEPLDTLSQSDLAEDFGGRSCGDYNKDFRATGRVDDDETQLANLFVSDMKNCRYLRLPPHYR